MAWLRAAGKTVKQPTEEEIPEMEAHDDPKPRKEDQLEDLRGGAVAEAAVQGAEDDDKDPDDQDMMPVDLIDMSDDGETPKK